MNQLNLKRYIKIGYFLLYTYIIYVVFVLASKTFIDLHYTITLSGMIFIAILLFIVAILEKNKYFLISSIMFISLFLFEILVRALGYYEHDVMVNPTIDIIYHAYFIATLIVFVIGVSKFLLLLEKRKFIHKLSFETSKSVYIEYDHQTKSFICELTKAFQEKYKIKRSELIFTKDMFMHFVKESDHEKINLMIDQKQDTEYTEINFKIDRSGDYIVFLVFTTKSIDKSLWVAFDISDVDAMKKQLQLTKTQLTDLTLASRKVIENANELICIIDVNGNIIQASNRYCDIFDCNPQTITGTYINTIGKKYHSDEKDWVKEIIDKKITYRVIEYEKGGEKLIISWKNIALTDALGRTKSIMTIGEDITELTKLQRSLEYQADYNQITHKLNQNGYQKKIKELMKSNDVFHIACFNIDIDDFFTIIDYYGVDISNKLLVEVSNNLSKLISKDDIISNHMEDQFILVLINPSKVAIENLIDKLQQQIIKSYIIDDAHIHIKNRIGYALYPEDTKSIDELLHYASLASYHQSDTSYNEVTKYNLRMKSNLEKNIILSNRLYEAISKDKIDVHMQYIVNGKTNKPVYVESLARWEDDVLGFVSPDEFFTAARKSSLIEMLENHLVKKSLSYFKQLKEKPEHSTLKLSLNLTPEMFLKEGFAKLMNEYVLSHELKHEDIVIEVSENTFVHNIKVCNQMIQTFKAFGFLIAIDDFGSKYSSLAVLEKLAYDIIKIDGSFINDLGSQKNLEIVKMISQIGRLSEKIIIAERVENKETSDLLIDNQIELQQGYYFHKPQKLI